MHPNVTVDKTWKEDLPDYGGLNSTWELGRTPYAKMGNSNASVVDQHVMLVIGGNTEDIPALLAGEPAQITPEREMILEYRAVEDQAEAMLDFAARQAQNQ